MHILNSIENSKVLILGFGREGVSTYKFLKKRFPRKELSVSDLKPPKEWDNNTKNIVKKDDRLKIFSGKKHLDILGDYDLVIKTPGIPNKLPKIKSAIKKGVVFTSQTEIFLEVVKGKVIGVTGTKGKSTTATLINHILQESGKKSILLGNIGLPCLDYVDQDSMDMHFVFEMSCHQLSTLKTSPHIAVFLNIFEEHLDYYEDFEDYFSAKANITLYQTNSDYFIFNRDFKMLCDLSNKTSAKKIEFDSNGGGKYIFDGSIYRKGRKFLSKDKIPLAGVHNQNNIMAAIITTELLGCMATDIKKSLKSFKPLNGRLEVVGKKGGVVFIDDTLSTIPEACLAAIDSFPDKNITLILGGYDRGVPLNRFASELTKKINLKSIVLVGQTSKRLKKPLKENFAGKLSILGTTKRMNEIVKEAYRLSNKDGVVLLSPAATSFDMFKNYKDRSEQFELAVRGLN